MFFTVSFQGMVFFQVHSLKVSFLDEPSFMRGAWSDIIIYCLVLRLDQLTPSYDPIKANVMLSMIAGTPGLLASPGPTNSIDLYLCIISDL